MAQAFRTALGQLLDYGYVQVGTPPQLVMFLDQPLDQKRLSLARFLKIALVVCDGEKFMLSNPDESPALRKGRRARAAAACTPVPRWGLSRG